MKSSKFKPITLHQKNIRTILKHVLDSYCEACMETLEISKEILTRLRTIDIKFPVLFYYYLYACVFFSSF